MRSPLGTVVLQLPNKKASAENKSKIVFFIVFIF